MAYGFKPQSLTNVLASLRASLTRDGRLGLEYVDALLKLRGEELPPVPCKAVVRFRCGSRA